MKPTTLFFDVNETLLDLQPLKEQIATALNDRDDLIPLWFSTLLHYSLVANATNYYQDFSEIGVRALLMIAQINNITLSKEEAQKTIIEPFKELPTYDDVKDGLQSLKDAGFTLVALTNSSQQSLEEKLKFAEIDQFFDLMLSSEPVKKFKPDPEVYVWALKKLNVKAEEAMLVASHAWDILGAQNSGMRTCFVERPNKKQFPLAKPADLTIKNLAELL